MSRGLPRHRNTLIGYFQDLDPEGFARLALKNNPYVTNNELSQM